MDDCCNRRNKECNNGLIDSKSYIIDRRKVGDRGKGHADLFSSHPLSGNIQAKDAEMCVQVCPMSSLKKTVASVENQATDDARIANPIMVSIEHQVKLDSLNKLKDSTRKLLSLLEDIQSKTYSKDLPLPDTNEAKLVPSTAAGVIPLDDEDDDCSIFKRLTRKCNCLNQKEYNDFIIHFNENTKYSTTTLGEIIKNMRILKKFLYMGGEYTKNALIFLNEGLAESTYAEKLEITQGCSHSDMCNVFEDHSIVIVCISWPCKYKYYRSNITQNLAASFLYKLAQIEEGRRYLKFTSKITNDIKKVLRKRGSTLDIDATESLKDALNKIYPPMTQNVTYYCRQNYEDYVSENINALQQYRQFKTLDEVFMHLDLLYKLSYEEKGKTDLILHLPSLLLLLKQMLKEYDNSEMNIKVLNILNNIVSKNMFQQKESEWPKTMTESYTATQSVKMQDEGIQMPQKKKKANNKSKIYLGSNKFHQSSRCKFSEFENSVYLNRSKNFNRRKNIITIPIEKK